MSSAGRFHEEFDDWFALGALGERVDLPAGGLVDELEAVPVQIQIEQLLIQLDEVQQPRVRPHVDHLLHLLSPHVRQHRESDLVLSLPLAHFILSLLQSRTNPILPTTPIPSTFSIQQLPMGGRCGLDNKTKMSKPWQFGNEKISQIISLSSNYKRHREQVSHIKPAIDSSNQKHMQRVLQLSQEKDRYTHNVRNLRLTELQRENQQIIKRMSAVPSALRSSTRLSPTHLSPTHLSPTHLSPTHLSPTHLSPTNKLPLSRSPSRHSLTSASSQHSCGSNLRRRTMRQKQIVEENKRIAARILHPKMKKDLNHAKLEKMYEQEQSYSRIRSRFSDRSQSILQTLALDRLKLQKRDVQFLPQLQRGSLSGRHNHSTHHTLQLN